MGGALRASRIAVAHDRAAATQPAAGTRVEHAYASATIERAGAAAVFPLTRRPHSRTTVRK